MKYRFYFVAKLLLRLMLAFSVTIALMSCSEKPKPVEVVLKPAPTSPPDWTEHAIWYQIYVERFHNGDTQNDPTFTSMSQDYPSNIPANWSLTPWNQNWHTQDKYFANLEGQHDVNGVPIASFDAKTAFRRYGGDLQGVLNKLDYLSELGVNVIYFNPHNDAPTVHKNDARHRRHIGLHFGPDPEGDRELIADETPDDQTTWVMTSADKLFLHLLKEAKKRSIRVVLDYSGPQQLPPLEDGIKSQEAKNLLFATTRRWLDPNSDGDTSDGVDGYLLNANAVAELPLEFWREYRIFVKSINPQAILVADVLSLKRPDKGIDPKPVVQGDIFDAMINHRWYQEAEHFFASAPDETKPIRFVKRLESLMQDIGVEHSHTMVNTAVGQEGLRLLTSLYNKDSEHAQFTQNPAFDLNKPDAHAVNAAKLLLTHQFTFVGTPHILAGDEMGMWGTDNLHNRKPLIWPTFVYEAQASGSIKQEFSSYAVRFDQSLFEHYQFLVKLRRANAVLSSGKIDFLEISDSKHLLSYRRFNKKGEQVFVMFNMGTKPRRVILPLEIVNTSTWQVWRASEGLNIVPLVPSEQLTIAEKSVVVIVAN